MNFDSIKHVVNITGILVNLILCALNIFVLHNPAMGILNLAFCGFFFISELLYWVADEITRKRP